MVFSEPSLTVGLLPKPRFSVNSPRSERSQGLFGGALLKKKTTYACTIGLFLFALIVCLPFPLAFAGSDDQPTIQKDTVQVTAFTVNEYKKNYDVWSWLPKIKYRVNGPIPSGGQLYVEFNLPTGPWVKFDCRTEETQPTYWWECDCGGRDIGEEKASTYTGPVTFVIKLRNELAGTNSVLFNGKMKVEKAHSNEAGPKAVNKYVYFVNHDWNLPIGYVWLTPDSIRGWDLPDFHVAFWVRGDAYKFDPHVFYQGKEIGRINIDGMIVGAAGCEAEVENNTTHYVEDALPQKAKWARVYCNFPNIKGAAKNFEEIITPGQQGKIFVLTDNLGDYEVKVLRENRLARSLKFTVAPGGSFDNGIGKNSKLGRDRVIVPVQIIGDQDGVWDKSAWKDAFYGNPLTGFTPLP